MRWKTRDQSSEKAVTTSRRALSTMRRLYEAFSWRLLAFHGHSPLLRASIAVLIIIPIWARTIGSQSFSFASFGSMGVLDTEMSHIPMNLLRLFWASASVTVAGFIFSLTCPPVLRRYNNFQEWLDNDEQAYIHRQQLTSQLGFEKKEEILIKLEKEYTSLITEQSFTKAWARYLILAFYILAAWLSVRVLLAQLASVWEQTCWGHLFF